MQNHVFVSKHPVATLQNPVFIPKGTFVTCETLFHFQNTLLHPCKTMFQFQNPLSQPATAVFKTVWGCNESIWPFSKPTLSLYFDVFVFFEINIETIAKSSVRTATHIVILELRSIFLFRCSSLSIKSLLINSSKCLVGTNVSFRCFCI